MLGGHHGCCEPSGDGKVKAYSLLIMKLRIGKSITPNYLITVKASTGLVRTIKIALILLAKIMLT